VLYRWVGGDGGDGHRLTHEQLQQLSRHTAQQLLTQWHAQPGDRVVLVRSPFTLCCA
jgi:acyl-coenzyme A synthetase/AMP-(fatty) acid ligase